MQRLAIDDVASDLAGAVATLRGAPAGGREGRCRGLLLGRGHCRPGGLPHRRGCGGCPTTAGPTWAGSTNSPAARSCYHFGAKDPLIPPEIVAQIRNGRPGADRLRLPRRRPRVQLRRAAGVPRPSHSWRWSARWPSSRSISGASRPPATSQRFAAQRYPDLVVRPCAGREGLVNSTPFRRPIRSHRMSDTQGSNPADDASRPGEGLDRRQLLTAAAGIAASLGISVAAPAPARRPAAAQVACPGRGALRQLPGLRAGAGGPGPRHARQAPRPGPVRDDRAHLQADGRVRLVRRARAPGGGDQAGRPLAQGARHHQPPGPLGHRGHHLGPGTDPGQGPRDLPARPSSSCWRARRPARARRRRSRPTRCPPTRRRSRK